MGSRETEREESYIKCREMQILYETDGVHGTCAIQPRYWTNRRQSESNQKNQGNRRMSQKSGVYWDWQIAMLVLSQISLQYLNVCAG